MRCRHVDRSCRRPGGGVSTARPETGLSNGRGQAGAAALTRGYRASAAMFRSVSAGSGVGRASLSQSGLTARRTRLPAGYLWEPRRSFGQNWSVTRHRWLPPGAAAGPGSADTGRRFVCGPSAWSACPSPNVHCFFVPVRRSSYSVAIWSVIDGLKSEMTHVTAVLRGVECIMAMVISSICETKVE